MGKNGGSPGLTWESLFVGWFDILPQMNPSPAFPNRHSQLTRVAGASGVARRVPMRWLIYLQITYYLIT